MTIAVPTMTRVVRSDVQGLRALAVAAVVANHLADWPTGGYLGVDVFFVVSGFLITSLLLRESETTGSISLFGFYRRRFKRIAPASILVLAATVVASLVTFNAARAHSVAVDAIWSAFSVANWRSLQIGTDYFQNQGPTSPLQHFWSLAVEEQFYLVWPAVLVTILAFSRAGRHGLVGIAIFAITSASFLYALGYTTQNATGAYFSTLSRVWELGAGALVAVAAPLLARIPVRLRPALSWLGLSGILVSFAVVSTEFAVPGPWAALPVASTMILIAGGTNASIDYRHPGVLGLRPIRYLGDISYSLYLWHFPVIVIVADLAGADSFVRYPFSIAFSLALAAATYHFVERPMIASPLLERHAPADLAREWSRWRHRSSKTVRAGGLAAMAGATALLVATAIVASGSASPNSPAGALLESGNDEITASEPPPTATATTPAGPALTTMESEIATALAATSWPELSPTLDSVLDGSAPADDVLGCGTGGAKRPPDSTCTFGQESASKTAVLVGDSTAVHYLKSFKGLVERTDDWRLVNLSMFACPFIDIEVDHGTANSSDCRDHNKETIATVLSMKPDLVIITNSYQELKHADTKRVVTLADWKAGIEAQHSVIEAASSEIVYFSPPPFSADVTECYSKRSVPASCLTRTNQAWTGRATIEGDFAATVKGTFIDSRPLVCSANRCPAFIGTTPVKEDRIHLSAAFAEKIVDAVGELFRAKGFF